MKRLNAVVFSLGLASTGCATDPAVYPVTDGFHKTLPQRNARIVVWGGHPSASSAATIWLQKRGVRVIERTRLQQVFDEQRLRLTHTPDDEAQMLQVGKLIGADTVVFLDTPIVAGPRGTREGPRSTLQERYRAWLEAVNPEIGRLRLEQDRLRAADTVYTTSVSIRGVNVETSEVVWSGTARYPSAYQELDDTLTKLTCQALATAWGIRPPGHEAISSQAMCEAAREVSLTNPRP